jgi:hypothetical protein
MVSNLDDALIWPLYLYPDSPGEGYQRGTAIEAARRAIRTGGQTAATDVLAAQDAVKDLILRLFPQESYPRWPNLAPAFLAALETRLGRPFRFDPTADPKSKIQNPKSFGPEDVFHYIYALFHAPGYRARYAEFLKIDFPRVPLTSDPALFDALVALGAELVDWHLLRRSDRAAEPRYPVNLQNTDPATHNRVTPGYPKYLPPNAPEPGTGTPLAEGRVYLNPAQYFAGVAPEVYAFQIGGYQVADKWLKDRRGRVLTGDEITHYKRVCVALARTHTLMAAIDAAIPSWPLP